MCGPAMKRCALDAVPVRLPIWTGRKYCASRSRRAARPFIPATDFLSENSAFARLCNNAGVAFVGPSPEALTLFGDKVQARALAKRIGAPVLPGSIGARNARGGGAFFQQLERRAAQ